MSQTPMSENAALATAIRMPNPFARVRLQDLGDAPTSESATLPVLGEQYREVRLDAISASSPLQTRARFDGEHDDQDQDLVVSLTEDGQRVPLLLTGVEGQAAEFMVLDGHRRVAALRHLGRATAKAILLQPGTLDCDLITLTAQVRKNLSPLEQATAVTRLRERHKLTWETIAQKVGIARSYLYELQELLGTDPAVQGEVATGRLTVKAARALGQAPMDQQPALARVAAERSLTERDAKRLVERVVKGGQDVEEAALTLGLVPAESPVDAEGVADDAQPEVNTSASSAPEATTKPHPRSQRALTKLEAAASLVESLFPELDADTAQTLAQAAVNLVVSPQLVKAAGLLVMSEWNAEDAIEVADLARRDPGMRQLITVLEACADLHAIMVGGHCLPEYAPMLASLGKKLNGLKQTALKCQKRRG